MYQYTRVYLYVCCRLSGPCKHKTQRRCLYEYFFYALLYKNDTAFVHLANTHAHKQNNTLFAVVYTKRLLFRFDLQWQLNSERPTEITWKFSHFTFFFLLNLFFTFYFFFLNQLIDSKKIVYKAKDREKYQINTL